MKMKRSEYNTLINKEKTNLKKKIKKHSQVLKNKMFLEMLAKSDKTRRNKIIEMMNAKELRAINEIFKNLLIGHIPVNNAFLKKIKSKKNIMRKFVYNSPSDKKKKTLLRQSGGILPLILPLAIKLLTKI